ncbi:hypothetical protein PAXRUDRAFT_836470 [Paxillus rubicundulus Ve08.2h10]|uniref:Uncharacterized protein n=1 Tax=Paxillus rubicundulus Ve08.2h10 TaxID=930991 RepID=A0A0D0CA19_9AGAM|nr:hypothetical protein PAXRUDRAFT_836470 [Paxillus rubicundulus Ve08.2h10]
MGHLVCVRRVVVLIAGKAVKQANGGMMAGGEVESTEKRLGVGRESARPTSFWLDHR